MRLNPHQAALRPVFKNPNEPPKVEIDQDMFSSYKKVERPKIDPYAMIKAHQQ